MASADCATAAAVTTTTAASSAEHPGHVLVQRCVANTLGRVELEERTIEQLPDRCQNCGAKLTDAEKRAALVEGPPSGLVLCTTCAAEVVPVDEDEETEGPG